MRRRAVGQKPGINTHPDRSAGVVEEEDHSTSETRQRNTLREECRCPEWGGAWYGGGINHQYRTVLLGLCLPLANYLVSFFTPDWSMEPPQDACATFCYGGSHCVEAYECMFMLIMGWCPLLFRPSRNLLVHVQTRKLPWSQEWTPYLLAWAELSFYP